MDDLTFERDVLAPLAARTAYPPTPAMRARVLTAIADDSGARLTRPAERPMWRMALTAVAAASAVALGVALVVPSSRSAIASFFGVEGSKVERLPTPAPGETATPLPPPAELPSSARPSSLEEAAAALGFEPSIPPAAGELESVYLVDYDGEPVAILRYPSFDLWQAPRDRLLFSKGVPEGVVMEEFMIDGNNAIFIGGGSGHVVITFDERNKVVPGSERTVDRNTLIWNGGQRFYRLESDLPKDDLVRIAESLP